MSKRYSYEQIAENVELWNEYVDPDATMTEEDLNGMTTAEKVELQKEIFGQDEYGQDEYGQDE